MKQYFSKTSDRSPEIFFDHKENLLKFHGFSMLENSSLVYEPIIEWIKSDLPQHFINSELINVDFNFEYLNTHSSRYLYQIISELNNETTFKKIELNINWSYFSKDTDMLELGQLLEKITDVKFNYISLS